MKEETCILGAFIREIKPFIDLLSDLSTERDGKLIRYRGTLEKRRVHVVKTPKGEWQEIGSLIRSSSFVISTGICGALVDDLHTGDIVVSSKLFCIKKPQIESVLNLSYTLPFLEIPLCKVAQEMLHERLKNEYFSIFAGPTVTTGGILKDRREKGAVHEVTGALSVEMEDFYRLSAARELGIPFLSVRSIFDELDDEILPWKGGTHPSLNEKLMVAIKSLTLALKSIITSFEVI